jgi:iron complex outermembrane receptor protein
MIFILVLALVGWSQGAYVFKGRILDKETNEPLPGTVVKVQGTEKFVSADEQGIFEFKNLTAGSYIFQISRIGYKNVYLKIELEADNISELELHMTPQPLPVEEILVTALQEHVIPQSDFYTQEIRERAPKDVGELFKDISGFGVIRKGGYAMDPVMRSFKYEQLNVRYDGGIYLSHACPNRMDPVTTHMQAEDLEKIEIVKGPFSVRHGQSMGGIVNLVMKRPQPTDAFRIRTEMESGYETNGDGKRARLSLSASQRYYDFYLAGGTKQFGNYKSGAGFQIPSSFSINDYSLKLGITPWQNHRFQLTWRQSFSRDVMHAGLPMDTRKDDTDIWALDYSSRNLNNKILSLSAKIYWTNIDHVMDNRERPNFNMVRAVATVNSSSAGAKMELGINPLSGALWYIGADHYQLNKDGSRIREVYMNPSTGMMFDPPRQFEDYIWQDSKLTDSGIFSEWQQTLGPRLGFLAGARVDFVSSNINNPAPQFIDEYGEVSSFNESNINLTASLNYALIPTTSLILSAGSGTRSPSLVERYINHLSIGMDGYEYFGNPHLNPETNKQVEISLGRQTSASNLKLGLFYSYIDNYITAAVDSSLPRLFMPNKEPRFTKRFQNVDKAMQAGFEISLNGKIYRYLTYRSAVAYTYGNNRNWNEPLAEIPPLDAKLAMRYSHPSNRFWSEISGRFVAKQDRVSRSFGETKTPGFTVINLLTHVNLSRYLDLNLGIRNLFDKNYYEHLNRRYINQPINEIIYEPGRNFIFMVKFHY